MCDSKYKISIIIPVYNVEKYLRECLESVLEQDIGDMEVICINDGSTDSSANILEEYKEKFQNYTIITQVNKGLSCARNEGLNIAKGEYIYFLDSDDKIAPNTMKELYRYAKEKQTDVLLFEGEAFGEKKEVQTDSSLYQRSKEYNFIETGLYALNKLNENNDFKVSVCLQFYKREFLEKFQLRFLPGILHEDNLFTFQCMFWAGRVSHLKKIFFLRRVRKDSITTSAKTWRHFWGLFYSYSQMRKMIDNYANSLTDDEVSTIIEVADKVLINARWTYLNHLNEAEREQLKKLPTYDYYNVKRLVIDWAELITPRDEIYPFPYYLLEPDSNIILYGAGNIGCRYYRQICRSQYVNIVKWVDKNYESIRTERLPVEDVNFEDCEFDYIFITIADEKIAAGIIRQLENEGIPKQKIIWCGAEYFVAPKWQMRLLHHRIEIFNQFSESKKRKIFLFITPEHGNLGDYAIALAERKFFNKYFCDCTLIEVTMPQWQQYKDEYKKMVSPQDLLCISGGGYLGNMWCSGEVMKEIISAFPNNQKVLFPNTLTYLDNDEYEMVKDAEFFRKQSKLLMMARDKNSFDRMVKFQYQDKNNISYYPDMALALNYSDTDTDRNGICICVREDKERSLSKQEFNEIIKLIESYNISFAYTDIHLQKRVPSDLGEYEIQKKIDEFKQYKLVITDRLHGMIFAAISGTPCIAFDNTTHKVFGVYEWIQSLPYIHLCTNLEEFKVYISGLEKIPIGKYNEQILEKQFEQLAFDIIKRLK